VRPVRARGQLAKERRRVGVAFCDQRNKRNKRLRREPFEVIAYALPGCGA
jgi:hypothetical protein